MNGLYLSILNMSFTGAFVIIVIWLARFPLKKAPKTISYLLWAVAGFRLTFPFPLRGLFSLLPFKSSPIPPDIAAQTIPRIESGITLIDRAVSSALPAASPVIGASPLQAWLALGSAIWLAGVIFMLIFSIVSITLLKKQLRGAVCVGNGIYEAFNLKTPFVIGLLRPQIFIPTGLTAEERRYIILHEQMHIRRRDPAIKIFAYFILSLHWFNPFAWLAFLLMNADMEMSCDERVMGELDGRIKIAYSRSLIRLAAGRPILNGSPLAFGEGGMKERIKNVLNFKKPSRLIIIFAVTLAAALGIGLALNRDGGQFKTGETDQPIPALSITTPRDFYSPFMSSIFGFELVIGQTPPNTMEFNYLCDKGSFCTYHDAQIKGLGNNVTTAETVYWTGFAEDEGKFITDEGNIFISVTALDGEGQTLALGTALVQCGDEGMWFKFLEEKPTDRYSGETPTPDAGNRTEKGSSPGAGIPPGPALMIGDELAAAGFKIIDVHEYGERFIEHSIITSAGRDKNEVNEVTTVYAKYEDQNSDLMIMNYTLRRPVTGESGWSHGEPIPWIDPATRVDRTQAVTPLIPTGEPCSSAATAARQYYRRLGYGEEAGTTMYSVQADYTGESEAFLSRLKDETVTLSIEFSTDPRSHPIRLIVLTRERGGKWEVVRADK